MDVRTSDTAAKPATTGGLRDANFAIPGAAPLGVLDTSPPAGNSLAFPDDEQAGTPVPGTGGLGANGL